MRSRSTRREGAGRRALGLLIAALLAAPTSLVLGGVAGAAPDPISVTVSGSPNPVASGTSLTWTIQMVNSSPDLHTVRLTDQVHGLKNLVLTSSRGFCTESNLLVTCEAGSMPGHNETWTVTIRGIVTAANGEVLNNAAIVTGRNGGQDFSVPATGTVLVGNGGGSLSDLAVSIAAPDSVAPGGTVPYTLTVNNSGGAQATDVKVTATVPAGFTATSAKGTNLFDCAIANPTVTCAGGEVNDGSNATIAIEATAAGGTGSYDATAVVDPENLVRESNEENNTASDTIEVATGPAPAESMTLTKTASSPVDVANGRQVRPGDKLTYTITATNISTKWDASKLQITDGTQGLDAASVQATSSASGLVCTPSASQVDCRAPNENFRLRAGHSVTVTIVGTVVQTTGNVITNTAVLQTIQNKVSITRRASTSTTVRPGVDLTVTQASTCSDPQASLLPCPPFRARNQFDYLITVGNSGLNDASQVVVREPLPQDVVFEGFTDLSGGGFSCAASQQVGGVVSCTGGTVAGAMSSLSHQGTIEQIRLHLTAPNSIGPITSTATVDPFNAIKESDETNNTVTTTTPIATGIDLTSMQTVNFDPVAPSGTLVYEVVVNNIGTQDATGIRISDVVPQGARFRSAKEIPNPFGAPYTPPHGYTCSFEETTADVVCTDGRLLGIYAAYGGPLLDLTGTPDSVTIEITLFAPAPFGPNDSPGATGSPILNQVMADPAGAIPEVSDANNLNILETNVGIPPTPGDWGTYNELTVTNEQTNPVSGAVAPNGTLEYTLTLRNFGTDPVSNVTVYDYIPQGARFRDAAGSALSGGSGGFGCSFNAGLVACTGGSLAAAPSVGTPSTATIKIKLFAPDTPNDQTSNYTNHAVIDPGNETHEADETNNVSDVDLVVELPPGGQNAYNQLTITNVQAAPTDTAPGPNVAPNGTLVYRLTIGNVGTDMVQNVVVRDYLPEGSRFRSARNNTTLSSMGSGGFACFHEGGIVECAGGRILGGGMAVIDITLFAPDTPATYDNQAFVDPENRIPEGSEQDNTATAETVVAIGGANEYIDLLISKLESDPISIATNTAYKYKIEVKNEGTDQAFNVRVSDYLPVGTHFVSAVDDNPGAGAFTCSEQEGTVDCTGGSIPGGGGTRNLTIVVRSPSHDEVTLVDNKTEVTNEARVDPDNAIFEGNETDNSAYVTTTILANVDLSAETNDGSACSSGSECAWTFSIKNNGPDPATGVKVRTDFPVGTIPLDVLAEPEWACQITENPINQVICVRPDAMPNGSTPTFTVKVYVTANSGNPITSTTYVDPDDTIVEPSDGNNVKQGAHTA